MLPQNCNPSRTIYINPNFVGHDQRTVDVAPTQTQIPANAHINPLFLAKRTKTTTIHMNPRFLLNIQERQMEPSASDTKLCDKATGLVNSVCATAPAGRVLPTDERKIICKSKNRLIREPVIKSPQKPLLPKEPAGMQTQPLVVVTKRKLIRKSVIPEPSKAAQHVVKVTTAAGVGTKTIKTKYKLDNRVIRKKATISTPILKIKRKSFVGRYALRRTSTSLAQPSPLKNGSARKSTNIQSMNRKLQLLNINGLLYKSTRNTLQLKNMSNNTANAISKTSKSASSLAAKHLQGGLTIFVRGTKYIMDSQKFKLTRVANTEKDTTTPKGASKLPTCRRIDIGGFTYVSAPSANNVLIRTSNHWSRAYVHNAKQKSLQVLSKHLVKSNVPCPIYQRVGKCAAFERGKCSKVHNKQQVAICSKFLRGECLNLKCLLSHDISLSKMPVCKFFLQGVCVRNDCPYLHKKLSTNAEVCIDFLRGFCQLADKCNKRHEFVCPELERTGTCANKNCLYCKSKLRRQKHLEKEAEKSTRKNQSVKTSDSPSVPTAPSQTAAKESHEKSTGQRYFIGASVDAKLDISNADETTTEDVKGDDKNGSTLAVEDGVRKRPKLGVLPAFIPL